MVFFMPLEAVWVRSSAFLLPCSNAWWACWVLWLRNRWGSFFTQR
jgi:hypothetical protein